MTLGERLTVARKRYTRNPSRVLLRRYLILKAQKAVRRGNLASGWDPRMCSYYGVSANVNDACKRAIVRGYARGLVPTSTTRPVGASSYHSQRNAQGEGMAVDLGVVEYEVGPTAAGRRRMVEHQRAEHRLYARGELDRMVELIGPDNHAIVLRDRQTDLGEGTPLETQHDNHVHEAYVGL